MPDLHQRLRAEPTRIADVGCGVGWSTLALARAFPKAEVVGVDLDAASIAEARGHAARAGLAPRFAVRNARHLREEGRFDLIVVIEALHDMRAPSSVLAALREALAPEGSILVVDERVGERFRGPADLTERLMYGWSVSHCLPAALAEEPEPGETPPDAGGGRREHGHAPEPTGTALRAEVVRSLAARGGLGRVEELEVSHELFRIYRLREERP